MTRRRGNRPELTDAGEIRLALIVGAVVAGVVLFAVLSTFQAFSIAIAALAAVAGGIAVGVIAAGIRPVRKAIAWVMIAVWIVATSGL